MTHPAPPLDGPVPRQRRSSPVVVLGGVLLITLLLFVRAHPPWERGDPLPEEPVLRVLDLATGEPVPGGVAYRFASSERGLGWGGTVVPGADALAGTRFPADAKGVIRLGAADAAAGVFVGAEGYAWRRVEPGTLGRLPWVVALGPGGRVQVDVSGWGRLPHPVLALGREDCVWSPPLPAPDAGGRILLRGIPAGRSRIEVCRGALGGPREPWASVEVDVPAGGEAAAHLDLLSFVPPTKDRLHGAISLPARLPVSRVELRIEGEPHEQSDGKGGTWESYDGDFLFIEVPAAGGTVPFLSGELPPGPYRLTVESFWNRTEVLREEGTVVDIDLTGLVTGVLRVVDEETGEPLAGARVSREVSLPEGNSWSEFPLSGSGRPGEFRFLGLPGTVSFSVEAPAHLGIHRSSGSTLDVLPSVPLDHEFRLARAAALEVTFRGGVPAPSERAVVLSRGDFRPELGWCATVLRLENGHVTEDPLTPGDYILEVDPGPEFTRLPGRPISLHAGETTRVVVDLEKRDPADPAAVRGSVTFSEGWGSLKSRVAFCGMERSNSGIEEVVSLGTAVPGVPARFSMGRLPPGMYRAVVDPQWRMEVEVGEDGGTFDFRIPAPAEVLLRVVAAEDGAPLADARLTWHSEPEGGIQGIFRVDTVASGPASGEFRLLVPPGNLVASVEVAGRAPVDLVEDGEGASPRLQSGDRLERILRLPAAGSLQVDLVCGGVAVLPPKLKVYFREGVGPVVNGTTSWPLGQMGEGLHRESLAPGTYTLDLWDPDGRFEPVESREFKISGGERTVVTVELKRSK